MADRAGTGGLEGALQWLDALNVATKITTVIALAALAVIVAFLISSQWLSGRRAQISRAIDKGDDGALAALLGQVNVSLDGMSPDEKFQMAREESQRRFKQKMAWQSFLFAGFLALLLLVWALVQPKPAPAPKEAPAQRITLKEMRELLPLIAEGERQARCARLLNADLCEALVAAAKGQTLGTPAQQAAATSAIAKGAVSAQVAGVLKGVRPVRITAGDAGGWDIAIRWCDGLYARRNRAAAAAAAQALAQTPGEQIAPEVKLGSIAVARATGRPDEGAYIVTDAGTGEVAAAEAVLATLNARGIGYYRVSTGATASKWRIELYECRDANIVVQGSRS